MTYQKKSYKKFVATAATATLVASAIVPVASASFSDVADTHEFAGYINKAVEAGYIKGYEDGTFGINKELTRNHVVLIIGRYLEKEGFTSTATTSPWSDVTSEEVIKYGNIVKEAGVFTGYADGTLDGGAFIKRENMAIVLDRLAKTVTGTSFSEVAEGIDDKKVADLATANADYRAAIQALRDLEISTPENFNPKGNVKRGQFAKFIVNAVEKIDEIEVVKELAIESVSAINTKSLKVEFNTAVDTTKAVFEVKKGSIKVNTSAITWNDAKTEATIELAGKLTAGEYTVNVTGLAEEALTGKVTAENERVEKVSILSENAVLTGSNTATVGYTVVNQYGEDITATTAITATAGGATVGTGEVKAAKGVATIPVVATAKEGDSIVLTLINTASGKSVSQTVKISAKAAVTDIAITGLYNKDGKTLTETTDLSKDKFYLLVEGKDQYGQVVKEDQLTGIIANNTNPLVAGVDVEEGQTPDFTTITVDGKEVVALEVVKPANSALTAGKTTVMLIATASGKNATYEVSVAEAQRTDSVTFDVPELVVANEDLFIPITVLDKEGNAVTDIKVINDTARGIKVSGVDNEVKVVDGVIGVAIAKEDIQKGYLTLVGLSSTAKSAIANIEVKEAAKPVRVDGLKSSVSTTLLTGDQLEITPAKLTIIDQYERELTTAQKEALFAAGYSLNVTEGDNKDTSAIKVVDDTITGNAKGTEKVTISIQDSTLTTTDKTVVGSEKTVTFRVTDGTEYASYEVADVATVLDTETADVKDGDNYTRKLEVYGVLADGSKVKLDPTKYNVQSSSAAVEVSGENIVVSTSKTSEEDYDANGNGTVDKGEDTFTAKLTVTINASGEQFVKDVTVSKEAPKAETVKVIADQDTIADGTIITATQNAALKELAQFTVNSASVAVTDVVDFVITDQYGVRTVYDAYTAAKFVGSPVVANTITFTNQNANNLVLSGLAEGEEAIIKATLDGLVKEFKIVAGDIVTPEQK